MKRTLNISTTRVIVFSIIMVLALISLPFSNSIEAIYTTKANASSIVASTNEVINNSGLQVHFVDVGQGDCIMINLPDGKNMIIDSGDNNSTISSHMIAYANEYIVKDNEVVDYLVLTHAHADHVGNMDDIIEEFQVNNIYRAPEFYQKYSTTNQSEITLNNEEENFASTSGVTLKENYNIVSTNVMRDFLIDAYDEPNCNMYIFNDNNGNPIITGSAEGKDYAFTFYTIDENEYYSPTNTNLKNPNNYSILIVLEYDGLKFAFTGDGEQYIEQQLIDKYGENLPNVDFMQMAHHGSKTASSQDYVTILDPEYAFVSVAEVNTYGLPDEEPIEVLNNIGVEQTCIFMTKDYGDIIIGMGYSSSSNGDAILNSNMAIALSKGSNIVSIKWWEIAGSFVLVSAIIIFLTPTAKKKVLKTIKK